VCAIGTKKILFLLLSIVFLLHLAGALYVAHRHTGFYLHDDGEEYLALAESFAKTGTFTSEYARYYEAPRTSPSPEAFRTLLLSLTGGIFLFIIRDPLTATAIFQAFLSVFLAWSLFRIAQHLGGFGAGVFALLLVFFHPLMTVFALRFSSELYFILFLALFIQAWLEVPPRWKFALMGLAGGLASGVRPTALLLLPAFAVFELITGLFPRLFPDLTQEQWKSRILHFSIYALLFVLAVLPWSVRSMILFSSPAPSGFLGGFNLFVGNNRDNAEAYRTATGIEFLRCQQRGWERAIAIVKAMPENLPPVQQQEILRKAVLEELRSMDSAQIAQLMLGKAWHFIRPWPLRNAYSDRIFFLLGGYECVLFALGVTGIFLLRKHRALLLFALMMICTGWSAHTLIHLQMRHRVPFLDTWMILFAAVTLAVLFRRLPLRNFFPGSADTPSALQDTGR